jgi:hypothetical protein
MLLPNSSISTATDRSPSVVEEAKTEYKNNYQGPDYDAFLPTVEMTKKLPCHPL